MNAFSQMRIGIIRALRRVHAKWIYSTGNGPFWSVQHPVLNRRRLNRQRSVRIGSYQRFRTQLLSELADTERDLRNYMHPENGSMHDREYSFDSVLEGGRQVTITSADNIRQHLDSLRYTVGVVAQMIEIEFLGVHAEIPRGRTTSVTSV